MRIGIDCTALPYPHGGVAHYIDNLLRELSLIDSENTFFLYSHLDFQLDFSSSNLIKRICPAPIVTALHVRKPLVRKEIIEDKIDVFWGPAGALPASLPFSVKTVLTVHDVCWLDFPQGLSFKSYVYHKIFLPKIMSRADKIICDSKFTASSLKKHFFYPESKLEVVYYGLPQVFKTDGKAPIKFGLKGDFILNVGTIGPRKNVANQIRAFKLLNKPIELAIAGVKEIDLQLDSSQVRLLGYVHHKDLAGLYRSARLMSFVSMYEGFGLPAIEAMACGCPCVLSDIPVFREIADGSAKFVDPKNIESIAEGYRDVIENSSLRRNLIDNGINTASKFNWRDSATKLSNIFKSL